MPAKKKVVKKKVAKKVVKKKPAKKVAKKKVVKKKVSKRKPRAKVEAVEGHEGVKMVSADNLPDALRAIAEDLAKQHGLMGKNIKVVTKKVKVGSKEEQRLNDEWDEYASGIRGEMAEDLNGQAPVKLAMLGATLDKSWRTAKTTHIKISMLQLGMDVIKKLNDLPVPDGLPAELVEMKRKSAEAVIEQYEQELERIKAPIREAEEKKEKEHVSKPAGGMFANVSPDDILNADKPDDLPDR